MELSQLIEERARAKADGDSITKLLTDIGRLEAKRAQNLYRLRDKASQLDKRLSQIPEGEEMSLREWLALYRNGLDRDLEQRRQQFGADLADGLESLGLKLKGQYPKLHAGLLTFQLDFEKGRCRIWYGPDQELLSDVLLDSNKVINVVKKMRSSLGSGLPPSELSAKIATAYRHVRLDYPEGLISLTALMPHMAFQVQSKRFLEDPRKRSYRDYGRADFSFDLYRMRGLGDQLPFRLIIATRQQTRSRKNFLWVPSREEVETGDYFTAIQFKEQ